MPTRAEHNKWNLDSPLLENESEHQRDLARKVSLILDCIKEQDMDLPMFLYNLVGLQNPACFKLLQCSTARGALYRSDLLGEILQWWLRHPKNFSGPKEKLRPIVVKEVIALMDKELRGFDKRMSKAQPDHETLTSFDFKKELEWIKSDMPVFWEVLHSLATTERGRAENTMKTPDMFLLVAVAQLSYSRSNQNNRMAQVFAVFFQGIGMPSRAFEVLHQMRICLSQRWADDALATLSADRMKQVARQIRLFASFVSGDNINIAYRVFSQRAYNRNLFESGTTATVFVTSRPPLPASVAQQYVAKAQKHEVITIRDFVDGPSTKRIQKFKVYHILAILLDSKWFQDYPSRSDAVLRAPEPVRAAPMGAGNRMRPYVLRTMKIDQSSYEGNCEWLEDVLQQMGYYDTLEGKKELSTANVITVVGDELTHKCLRGLKRFRAGDGNALERLDFLNETVGWFHVLMTLAQLIWNVHCGSRLGTGLLRDATLLNRIHFRGEPGQARQPNPGPSGGKSRKGKEKEKDNSGGTERSQGGDDDTAPPPPNAGGSKKTSQMSYHDLDELITQALKAHILNAWLKVAGLQKLEDLNAWKPSPAVLVELAERILREYGSSKALDQTKSSSIVSKPRERKPKATRNAATKANATNITTENAPTDPVTEEGQAGEPSQKTPSSMETAKEAQSVIFENGVRFIRDAMNYHFLRTAIRDGDVGRVEDAIRPLAVMFKGAGHPRYALLMAETLQKLLHEYPPELRDYVTDYCWILSRTGKPGTFHPVDQAQEHMNLQLKVIHSAKGPNSSWEYLAKMSPAIPTYQSLVATIGQGFPTSVNGITHTSPDESLDIQILVEQLQQDRVAEKTPELNGGDNVLVPRKVKASLDAYETGFNALSTTEFLNDWKTKRKTVKSLEDIWAEESAEESRDIVFERDEDVVMEDSNSHLNAPDNADTTIYYQEGNEFNTEEGAELMEHLAQVPLPGLRFDPDPDPALDPALALARDLQQFHVHE